MPPEKHSSLDGERPRPSPVLREARFHPPRGWGRHTCQPVPVILPPHTQEPCKSLAFPPPICTPRPVSPRQCSPHSPAFPAGRPRRAPVGKRTGEKGAGGRRRESPAAWERTEPPVPGREPKGTPTASRRLLGNGFPGCSDLRRGCGSLPARGAPGSGARRAPPARGRASQVPGAPHPPAPPARAPPALARAPTVQKPRAEAASPGPGPGCRRRARSAPLPPGRRAPPGAQARPGPGAAAAPAPPPPPLQRPPPPAPPVAAAERPSRGLWRAAGRVASAPAI